MSGPGKAIGLSLPVFLTGLNGLITCGFTPNCLKSISAKNPVHFSGQLVVPIGVLALNVIYLVGTSYVVAKSWKEDRKVSCVEGSLLVTYLASTVIAAYLVAANVALARR